MSAHSHIVGYGAADKKRKHAIMMQLHRAQECICSGCGKPIVQPGCRDGVPRADQASLDHTLPRALGGIDRLGNLTLMHKLCNEMKGNDMPTGCECIWLIAVNCRTGIGPQRW